MDSVRHEQILRAAVEVFVERGYRGTSIDAVAERAGLTRQGVLHYYPSKKRLYFALLHFREALTRQHVDHDDEPPDMACRFAEALEFDLGIPSLAQVHSVVMAEAAIGQEPARGFARARSRELNEMITRELTACYGPRLPSGLTARAGAAALLALVAGLQQQWLVQADEEETYPVLVRDSIRALLLGSTEAPAAGERGGQARTAG